MTMWLCRAGRFGEYENKFIEDGHIYCTWDNLDVALTNFKSRQDLQDYFVSKNDETKVKTAMNWASQVWPFGNEMAIGEIVALPSKINSVIHFGRITGEYEFSADAPNPFYHRRSIDWFALNVPRSCFDQDILYSFGAFMTICRIKQEKRVVKAIEAFQNHGSSASSCDDAHESSDGAIDIEAEALSAIAQRMIQKVKGHDLARIVDAILQTKGYATLVSPPGPDKGVDILAAPGTLGFDRPRICVQVKSGESPIERAVLDQLIGVMRNFNADHGLLVSWGGFKSSVERERAKHFFEIRLWDHNDIIREFLNCYDNLPSEIQEIVPLRKIWVLESDVD